MHHAEAVGDESPVVADEFDEVAGQRLPLRLVLAGFARIEANVLEQEDVAVGQAFRAGQRVLPDDVAGELDVAAEHVAEFRRDRGEGELRIGLALGPAQVGGDDDLRARLGERGDRRGGRDDATGVGDRRAVQRDVEVRAHQHATALDAGGEQILESLNCHCSTVLFGQRDFETRPMRSTRRLE